jgi:hypothetical protein
MVFTTQCPQCGKVLWFGSSLAGKLTICPACGAVMRLTVPTPPPTEQPAAPLDQLAVPPEQSAAASEATAPAAEESVPPAVEETYLTHQAAAAVGEVHVEMEESDVVQWTIQSEGSPPAPPAAAAPDWLPAPLSGLPPPQQQIVWSSPRPRPGPAPIARDEDDEDRRRTIYYMIGAGILVVVVVVIIWLLQGTNHPTNWEQAHRDEILSLKQDAEQLALSGKTREAYEKYQALERLVAGQTIQDPFLQDELDKSWKRRDQLYDKLMQENPGEGNVQTPPPATSPSAEQVPPTSSEPSTQPAVAEAPPPEPSATEPTVSPPTRPAIFRPPVRPDIPPVVGVTDAEIGDSITKGVDFLLRQFTASELSGTYDHYEGLDTLAVYALMQAELATHDRRIDIHSQFMIDAINAVKKFPMSSDYVTYARALRATALALYDRSEDHFVIKQDVDWLLNSQEHGGFTYNNQFPRQTDYAFWDNSNSQYGLLGVWSGAEAGVQVPLEFWRDVRTHWTKCQRPDGQWTYRQDQPDPSRSMTLAGIASLFVAQDYLDSSEYADEVGRPPFDPALQRAMDWLERGENSVIALPNGADYYTYYALYGLERTGLASGFKFYGEHDWYRERAQDIIARQDSQGSWGSGAGLYEAIVDTSYSLLFLARGRHPILMNKLRYDGDWANRPRDVANLARFASEELERPLNWQVVPLNRDWRDWTDSPILYLAGDKPPPLTQDDKDKIKAYIQNGGLLLTQADGGSEPFTNYIQYLGHQLFPQYSWTDLPPGNVLFTVTYRLSDLPRIQVITNGSRILMIHCPTDMTRLWQHRIETADTSSLELGVNLALYAAGKSELKNRLEGGYFEMPPGPPAAGIALGEIKYDGNWAPEPAAWPRARRWFRQQTTLDIDVQTIPMENLAELHPPIAHLTGTTKMNLTDEQLKSLKAYVENGGVLLIDPCGMPDEFLQSVHDDLLLRIFPDGKLDPIPDTHPLLIASGNGMTDVTTAEVRQFVRTLPDVGDIRPTMLKAGQGHVIILPLDLVSGLLGTDAWGIAGYQPEYSLQLMKNIVLWTWDGAKD